MRSLIAALLALLAATLSAAEKPNIVYVLCDDLGYGDLQCLNPAGKIATPNFDRLAAGGMIFTDVHSGSAVCSPTRYGILTGRYAWRTRRFHTSCMSTTRCGPPVLLRSIRGRLRSRGRR